MANKRFIASILATALVILPAAAQDIEGNLSVFCGSPTFTINYSSNKCTLMTLADPNLNAQGFMLPGQPSSVAGANNCTYVTVYAPYAQGEWLSQTQAHLVDGIACIPFFWGQWWNNWGPSQLFPNSPDPVLSYYNLNVNTSGMNGQVITAIWNQGPGPITDAGTACRAYAEGLLTEGLTTNTIVGAVPEWTCPCLMPPVEGDGCPDGWGGLGWGSSGEWGTIYATGNIFATAWEYITIYEATTYVFPGTYTPIVPINPYPHIPTNPPPTTLPTNPPPIIIPTNPIPTNPPPIIIPTNPPPIILPTNPPPIIIPTNPIPTNPPPCPLGYSVSVILNIQQWLNNTYDPDLEITPTAGSTGFYAPVQWSSPNANLYGGANQGYAWITYDSSDYYWINFGTSPSSGNITPVGSSQAIVTDQTALIALSAVNGPTMPLQAQLAYGLAHDQLGLPPVAGNGATSMQIPMSSSCVTIGYQWPTGTGPIYWPTNGTTGSGAISLQGSLCIGTGDPNEQALTLTWSTTNMTNLTFFSDDPDARPFLPTNVAPSGTVVIPANFNLSGYGLSALEITLTGTDTNGDAESASISAAGGTGDVTVDNVSTNVIVTNANQVTVSWTMDITTGQDPTSQGTYPLVQVFQSGNAYPLLSEYVSTPASNQTFSATSSNGGPMTLTVSDSCNAYTNTVEVPTSQAPVILEYGIYPSPGSPVLLTASSLGTIGNPGTVLYEITNRSPGATVTYTLTNPETGSSTTGTFTNSVLWYTNDVRCAIMSASASSAGTIAAGVSAPLTHLYVETPVMNLSPVLYNDLNVLLTNQVQFHNALVNEYIQLNGTQIMSPEIPTSGTSFVYPAATSTGFGLPGAQLPPGVLALFIGGNNQDGFWTNTLYNSSTADLWYNYTPDAPSGLVPLQPTGETNVSTVFDVAPIMVQLQGCDLTAATITTNAALNLVQYVDGDWITNASSAPSPAAASAFDFGCVDLGYPSVITGTRPYYNPTETNLPIQVVFQVTETPCGAYVTINHAITNIVVQGGTADGGYTNYTYAIPPFTGLTENITITNAEGNYYLYGYPITSASPIITNVSMAESGEWVPFATGGTLTLEANTNRYMLVATNSGVLTLSISTDNTNMQLEAQSPWQSNSLAACTLDLTSLTNSTSLSTTNLVVIPTCSTNLLPIDVVLNLNGVPPFDIPTSIITTNDCLDFLNGTPTIDPSQ